MEGKKCIWKRRMKENKNKKLREKRNKEKRMT